MEDQVIPKLFEGKQAGAAVRVWSVGCSTGEEAYSLAILLAERMEALKQSYKVQVFATDIDSRAIVAARAGVYPASIATDLTPERLARWFQEEAGAWRVSPRLRQMVSVRQHNLLQGTSGVGTFDIIFCRNVLIYFDLDGKRAVLDDLARALTPDGALFLGSAETILGLTSALEPMPGSRGLHRKAQGGRSATGG